MSVADNPVVREAIRRLDAFGDAAYGRMLLRCLDDTLARTIRTMPDGTVFVVTGDIPAMWLRDSTTQLMPFLAIMRDDRSLQDLVIAVLRRQFWQIQRDPYANAFNSGPSGRAHDPDDLCDDPWVWERKYEVDSLAFPLLLAHRLWCATGRTDHLAEAVRTARTVIRLWRVEQDHESLSPYRFVRHSGPPSDTLGGAGRGTPVARTGMTWSGFRPSDDACAFGYNVPANLCASAALTAVTRMARSLGDAVLEQEAAALAAELRAATERHGVVTHPEFGQIYAYEVDGLGNALLIDDANMPSLLSLPITAGVPVDDPLYAATRAFVRSPANPTWYRGSAAEGVGSPHTPPDHIWPIAIAVDGLTSDDPAHARRNLRMLLDTDAGTGAMHESFHKDDPGKFTRPWFSWANAMYAELALDTVGLGTRPLWAARAPSSRAHLPDPGRGGSVPVPQC
ncbi:glycoside hydrolase family 125 protein [Kitasatospora sp. NPDC057015]|uniref:glycoside hydrolase family 125 protein n=1 Tax=Kitasatospora sp. NPDC057015 TaxID=3346001 RepID=UPI003630B10E